MPAKDREVDLRGVRKRGEWITTLLSPHDNTYLIVVAPADNHDGYRLAVVDVTGDRHDEWDGLGGDPFWHPLDAMEWAIGAIWSHEEQADDA